LCSEGVALLYNLLPESFLTLPVPNERHQNTTSTGKIIFLKKNKRRFILDWGEPLGRHGQELLSRNGRSWSFYG